MTQKQAMRAVQGLLGADYTVRAGTARTGNIAGHSHQWHQTCKCWYVERNGVEVAHGGNWVLAIMAAHKVVTGADILTTTVKQAAGIAA